MMRRKRYLVNIRFQLGIFLKWVILPLIIISASLYCLYLIPPLRKVNRISLILGPIILMLISLRVLILSHRIAGPIYRLEKELKKIAAGDFSIRIKFRKKDELKSIAEGINRILDEIERRLSSKERV